MAEAEVANLVVAFSGDTSSLSKALAAAKGHLKGFEGAAGGLDKQLKKATEAMDGQANVQQKLAQLGIQTTEGIEAQIKALDELKEGLKADAVATAQLTRKQMQLKAQLGTGAQKMQKMGDASHRSQLFMVNLSRGLEDLKFGLPAVINNLDSISLSFTAMQKASKSAGNTLMGTIVKSIMSPAGILAAMNAVITIAFLFGDQLKAAFGKASKAADGLREATKGILGDLAVESAFNAEIPKTQEGIKDLVSAFKNYRDEVRAAKEGTDAFTTEVIASGAGAVAVRVPTEAMAEELGNIRVVSKEAAKQLKEYAVSLETAAIAAEIMSKKVQDARTLASQSKPFDIGEFMPGSLGALEQQIAAVELAMRRVPMEMRSNFIPLLRELQDELERATFEQGNLVKATEGYNVVLDSIAPDISFLPGSLGELKDRLKDLTEQFDAAYDAAGRDRLAAEINATKAEIDAMTTSLTQQKKKIEEITYGPGSWGAMEQQLEILDEELRAATTSQERFSKAQEMYALQVGPNIERAIMDVNDAIADFPVQAALAFGDSATGGFFDGLFGSFSGSNATDAKVAIADLRAEFDDLEQALADGEISYEQFVARNNARMRDMREAQKEIALSMRSDMELALARIGNAFQGMASMARKALQQIAQDFVTILVRRGIAKLLAGVVTGGGSGIVGGAVRGALSTPSISNPALRVSMDTRATVIPSGDLRIAVEQAGVNRARTGV